MRTKRQSFFAALCLAALAALLYGAPVGAAQPSKGVMKGTLHFTIAGDWLDPSMNVASQTAFFPLYLLHDSLLKPMQGNMYAPCLAESWTVSPDYRVYEFKLRKGVKFHNGDELTAEDVVFTFWRYKATMAKFIHDKTESVEAVNPYAVRFRFKEPFPNFLELLLPQMSAISWIVPKKYIERVGDTEFRRNPVGCGPYKFVEFRPGVRIVGEAFEGYWRKTPKVKRLEYYFVEEVSTRYAMVKNGEVDYALSLVDVFFETVKKDPKLRLVNINTANHWFIYLASQWDPKSPWADPRVRKAASMAIDRKAMSAVVFPEGDPIGTLFPGADAEGVSFPPDPYDPAGARKMLAEAGYPKGFHGGKFFAYGGSHAHMGEMTATFWKAIGINVDSVLFDRAGWIAQRAGGQMKGAIFNENVGTPTISSRMSYLFGPQSYGNYPEVQTMWDQYLRTLDPKIKVDLLARIQRFMYEKTMFIALVKSTTPSAFGPRVKGDPFKIRGPYPIWWPCPMEDLELND
jgi:peptide/nickel transport system substrate-binding protein